MGRQWLFNVRFHLKGFLYVNRKTNREQD
jgi:hypothetical protein